MHGSRFSVATVLLCLAICGAPSAARNSLKSATDSGWYDITKIETEFNRQCANGSFSGVVVVRAHGRDLFAGSCGDADILNHIANTRETRFKIYSTSKLITALTVMRLAEQKRLNLDAPITQYIAEAPLAWNNVTLRELLHHTSGIKDLTANIVIAYRQDYDSAIRDMFAALTSQEMLLDSPPGVHFAYNNFGFELLAVAVERITGDPFGSTVKTLVFEPAGMKTASFQPSSVVLGHLTDVGEEGLALGYNGEPTKLVQANNWAFVQLGAGAIRATVDDFIALDAALSSERVIHKSTMNEMLRDPIAPPADYPVTTRRFGLGIFVQEIDTVRLTGHTGGTNGYISDFERVPEDDAMMIALTNRGFVGTSWLRLEFAHMLKSKKSGPH